jgi:hypothetical protein
MPPNGMKGSIILDTGAIHEKRSRLGLFPRQLIFTAGMSPHTDVRQEIDALRWGSTGTSRRPGREVGRVGPPEGYHPRLNGYTCVSAE